MTSAGVTLAGDAVETFNNLKLGRKSQFILYKIDSDTHSIVVDSTYPPGASHDDFLNSLDDKQCRYVVLDFPYEDEGANRNKIIFGVWAPDTAPIEQKKLYASSKDTLRKALVGIQAEVQGTDRTEITHQAMLERVQKI
ncbi:actin-binding ADF family protein [Streptomyces sp. NPDC102282]|uniref:actin-binding ADF family protein n=1 Tax=Streptomyces sp. NPDC102282 TaxID=3366154 RepID=UPI0037FBD396